MAAPFRSRAASLDNNGDDGAIEESIEYHEDDETLKSVAGGLHLTRHTRSHYDLHSMFGWSETEPTLRGVQSSTGKRGLVLSRFNLSSSGFFSSA